MNFDRYVVALLRRPAGAASLGEAEGARLQDAHLAHLASLHEQGKLLAAGPFLVGPEDRERGLGVFGCDLKEARELSERDPLVIAGQIEYVFLPWMTPAGTLSFAPVRYPRSRSQAEE